MYRRPDETTSALADCSCSSYASEAYALSLTRIFCVPVVSAIMYVLFALSRAHEKHCCACLPR